VDRRAFLGTLASGLLAAPLAVGAQQARKVWRIGVMFVEASTNVTSGARVPEGLLKGPFGSVVDGLKDLGWIEGHNIMFELRSGSPERLADLAADLVRVPADVIVVPSAGVATIVRRATTTIPIVVLAAGVLEGSGLVASLTKPGGNVTGMQIFSPELIGKRLQLLRAALPTTLARVGVLSEFLEPEAAAYVAATPELVQAVKKYREETDTAGRALRLELAYVTVRLAEEFDTRFIELVARRAQVLLVYSTPFMFENRTRLAALALQYRLPSMFEVRAYVDAGGFMSYGVDLAHTLRRGAVFIDKILKGAKPADLPIEQPTKFELVINLKTAKALGLTIPQSLLLRADQVIE
jgi:putative ABC transport system substrate-binding protein